MNQIVSNLLVYGKRPEDSILWQLSDICMRLKDGSQDRDVLRTRVFGQVKNLLSVSTDYAFDKNLWQNYLTFLLITSENPFSLVCEKVGAQDGTVNIFVKHDLEMFRQLFHYDFSWMEEALSIDCFYHLTHYKAIRKKELMYNRNVSEKVRAVKMGIRDRVLPLAHKNGVQRGHPCAGRPVPVSYTHLFRIRSSAAWS